jgi:hypothetical protein
LQSSKKKILILVLDNPQMTNRTDVAPLSVALAHVEIGAYGADAGLGVLVHIVHKRACVALHVQWIASCLSIKQRTALNGSYNLRTHSHIHAMDALAKTSDTEPPQ